jgi:hypothetical protein
MNPALLFGALRLNQRRTGGAPAPEPSGDVVPALTVEYIDGSGVRHTTEVVDGVTSISGVAPFLV